MTTSAHNMNLKLINFDSSWSLFLDRDGVINHKLHNDYVKHLNEFRFLDGVLTALKLFAQKFQHIVVVTNQQGIGKGFYSEDDLQQIHTQMLHEVEKSEGRIDKIYFCPALAAENSPNRKPNTGMALQAQKDFPEIDFKKSIIVGDSISDMEFGKRLGMTTIFVSQNEDAIRSHPFLIDAQFESLAAFAQFLA